MTADTTAPFAFRKCLLLCLPALLLGLAIRVALLVAIPEGYFGSDSNSFFDTAEKFRLTGDISMGAKRAGLYPIFLLATTYLPGNSPQATAILQHALGLAGLVGIGWITAHFVRRRHFWVPIVTLIAAVLPGPLWAEHEMIADSLLADALVLAIALTLPVARLRDRKQLLWFLLSLIVLVSVKPHARPCWLGLMIAAVVLAGNPLRWGWKNHAAVACSIFLMISTGSSKQSSWLFLSSTLPLVNLEKSRWAEYRADLRPLVERARTDTPSYPWRQGRFKKLLTNREEWPDSSWGELLKDERKFSKVAKSLAMEAVIENPLMFTRFVLKKFGIALSKVHTDTKFDPQVYWFEQNDRNAGRWVKRPRQLEMLYEFDQAAYVAMVEQRLKNSMVVPRSVFQMTEVFNWFEQEPGKNDFPRLSITWFGVLGLLGIARCLLPANWRRSLVLLLPCFLYLGIVYVVGDSLPRYIMPVEWCGLLFGVLGVELILDLLRRLVKRSAADPQPAISSAAESSAA